MSKLITPAEKRAGTRKILTHLVIPAVGFWLLAKATAGAPAVGAILTAVALAALTVWATRYDPSEQAGPDRGRVLSADVTLGLAAVFGVLTAGKAGMTGPAVIAPVVLAILSAAALRLAADGSRAAALVSAYRIAWRTRRTDAAVALTAGLAIGTGIALTGLNVGGLLATLVAFAPLRWTWQQARAEQDLRAAVEAALAGVLNGGPAWTPVMANAGRAPIRRFSSEDGTPTEIVLPLPPAATATRQEDLEAEISDRMSPYGKYIIRFAVGRDRKATVTLVEPLPARLAYDGRAAVDGTKVWIGTGMATREHRHAPGTPGIANGAPFDFTWNLRTEPHGIAVGLTGSGKSQTIQLVMTQLALAGWAMVLIDPKKVEFSGWVGRPGVLRVTTDLEAHVEALEAARVEMDGRYAEMTVAGVNHIDLLPVEARPRRLLVVVDEVVELLSPAQGKTDTAKAANELKGRAQEAISSILRLGRAAGCHLLIAGQRADRSILTGEAQNNLAFKIIQGRSEQIERTMIGLGDVIATPGVAGRAVARTLQVPQSELQVAYIDLQDLDRYVPVGGVQPDAINPEHPDLTVPEVVAPLVPVQPVPRAATVTAGGPDGTVTQAGPAGDESRIAGRPGFTLDEVGGYETVKAQLLDTVGTALADSEGAAAYGIQTGGVLLYGPPGTGKTHIAEALAGTLGVNWLKVSVTDLTSQWVGEGARKIEAAVDSALAAAPCILLIDEIDAIAGRRDDETSGEGRKGVNALLVQLDRLKAAPGVVVLATTNDLSRLDPAVIRDGRFDARVRIDLPDEAARVSILRTVLAGRPADPTLDVADVAGRTGGYSAAMLTALINAAARAALADRRPIVTEDVLAAISARGGQDRPTVEQAGLDGLVLTDETDKDLREVLAMLADPDRARRYGIAPPSGLLLAGPPGTGKTSIAKALAAEAKTSFYAVSPGEWTSKWQGEAEKKVREVFERARANAPSIIFVDEIDAIGAARGGDDSSGGGRILTTLLAEMDGFGSAAAGRASVFVIAATNRPDVLDPALVRPGRLSRTVTVGLPDLAGRVALLARMTAGVPLAADVNLTSLAQATDGLSPADLGGVVQEAAMVALRSAGGDAEPVVDAAAFAAVLPASADPAEDEGTDGSAWLASLLDNDDPAKV